jgi:uncharacterized protein YwgA
MIKREVFVKAYDLILMVVANEPDNKIVGRTLLQKKVYFLNEMIKGSIRFIPHFYGPYSRNIANSVDSLVSTGIILEKTESLPQFQTPWGDSTRYSYHLSNDVDYEKIEKILKRNMGSQYDKALESLLEINKLPEANDYHSLSIAAKVRQILKEKRKLKISAFSKEAKSLGWNITQPEIDKAINLLKELKLIRVGGGNP